MAVKKIYSILILALIISVLGFGTERIVDGVGGTTNRYATIAAAVTAASTNDTIRVLSGLYNEADVSVTKKLNFIGNGYRNIANGGTHLATNIDFQSGSDGSRLIGFRFISGYQAGATSANNILIANNYFINGQAYATGSTNDTIRNNIFIVSGGNKHSVYIYNSSNVVVCNNIIRQNKSSSFYGVYTYSLAGNVFILNNFFDECYYSILNYNQNNSNHIVTGNIFYKCATASYGAGNALLHSGNVYWNMDNNFTEPGNAVNNKTTSDPLFEKFETSTGYVYQDDPNQDSDLRIKTGSDAIDQGYPAGSAPIPASYVDYHPSFAFGGAQSDAGVYGGPYPMPFPLGYPTVPIVTSINISPAVVSPGGTITVKVGGSIGGFTGRNN